jgi:hypothetical protein
VGLFSSVEASKTAESPSHDGDLSVFKSVRTMSWSRASSLRFSTLAALVAASRAWDNGAALTPPMGFANW